MSLATPPAAIPIAPSVDAAEIARFEALARRWWDEAGPMAPLHRINPVRLAYLRARLLAHFGGDAASVRPFDGLTLVDLGCGGGLVSEPLARLGCTVTGIDAGAENVAAASAHAAQSGIEIDYRVGSAEALAADGASFDIVLALEIVEHVPDQAGFMATAARLVKPGGLLVASTLNRTARGFMLGIVAAEHVLGWLPRGTHRWDRFVRPSELAAMVRAEGLTVTDLAGMSFDPLCWEWRFGKDLGVNYTLVAARAP